MRTISTSLAFAGGTKRLPVLAIQARTSARKAASCGVSSKSTSFTPIRSGRPRQFGDQPILPLLESAEGEAEMLAAPVIEMTIVFPGNADAAVHLDQLAPC